MGEADNRINELATALEDLLELHVAHTGPFNEAREIAHWRREESLGNSEARRVLAAYAGLKKARTET